MNSPTPQGYICPHLPHTPAPGQGPGGPAILAWISMSCVMASWIRGYPERTWCGLCKGRLDDL